MNAAAFRDKYNQRCPECGSNDFVDDHSQGDLICKDCGLVLESHAIDTRSEWRTFGDSDKTGADPNRVGGPTNHLLSDGGLSTVIAGATNKTNSALTNSLQRLHTRSGGGADRSLSTAFRAIGAICDKLGLVRIIKDRACELYKKISEAKSLRGRQAAAVYAAVIYIACKQENNPRTFKEVTAVVPEASRKDITKSYNFIVKGLDDVVPFHAALIRRASAPGALSVGGSAVNPADFIPRFSSHLLLDHTDVKAARAVASIACPQAGTRDNGELKPWDGRSPLSIAAAIIYLVTRLPRASKHPSAFEVAAVVGIAESTVQVAYSNLKSEARTLIPAWFAKPEEIARLPDY